MRNHPTSQVALLALVFSFQGSAVAADPASSPAGQPVDLILKKEGLANGWSDFVADSAAGKVSAADLLGLSGDAVHEVDNVKGLVLALRGAGNKGEKNGFGLSITPARTSIAPMNLSTYASGGIGARLLGSLTFAYAQGSADQAGQSLDRRAISLETSSTLYASDDPVLAYANALATGTGDCDIFGPPTPPSDTSPGTQQPGSAPATVTGPAADAVVARAASCRELAKSRWNASKVTAAFGQGRVSTPTGEHSLGRTLLLTLGYGFEQVAAMRDGHHVSLTLRRSRDEPVLASLVTAAPSFKSTSLSAVRYTVGSPRIKALIEASNARDGVPTASETTFRRALGIDVKLQDQLWLGLRIGTRRKFDGSGTETASLLNLNYSPVAVLKP